MGSWFRTSTLANPNVTFPSHGIATVTLNVTDPFGLSGQVSETFTVLQGPPQANYVYSPLSPLTFDSVNFQSTSSDPEGTSAIANYAWWIPSLGQSVSSNRATSVTASWKEDGLYAVFLNVSDNAGHFSNVSRNVFVSDRKPTAQFTFSPSQAAARSPLSFHGTALDADGTITKVVWAFGDGTTLSGPPSRANLSPTHTYSAPGQYVVSLVAFDDDSSASPTFSQAATITPPPPLANFTWSPVFPTPGEPIQFQDTSATQGTRISQWNWQFGDGQSSSLQNPQHGFSVYGPEPVSLTVTDDNSPPESDTITKTVIVNAPPVASFTMGTLSLARPSSFTSTSTDADDSIANWTWRFGDGAFGWGSTVSHTYTQAGAFTVTLFVTDTRGATSSTSSIAHIVEVPPAISFSVSPTTPVTNAPVLFAGQASDPEGSSMTFSWSINAIGVGSPNVGSGSTQNLSFTFTSSGIYLVSFTVQDAFGGQSTTSQAIRVVSSVPKSLEFLLGNPDGTPFNLSSGAVVPSGTLTAGAALPAIALPARALAPQPDLAAAPGGLVALTLPAGSWAAGDLVNLEFYGVLPKGQVGTFQDTLTASPTELAGSSCLLALQAVVTVTVHPPTSSLGVVPAYPLGGSDVVRPGEYDFANPTEPVVVTLSGHWQGTTSPTVGVPLYTETVYTALHSFDFRNSDPRANSTASLLRLVLPEVSGITNRTGQVDLVAPPFVGFVPSAVAPSNDLYLPGWYYMQAQVQFNGYHPVGSVFPGVQHWFEDPDGALEPVASGT
jgi:PKD repeat protein